MTLDAPELALAYHPRIVSDLPACWPEHDSIPCRLKLYTSSGQFQRLQSVQLRRRDRTLTAALRGRPVLLQGFFQQFHTGNTQFPGKNWLWRVRIEDFRGKHRLHQHCQSGTDGNIFQQIDHLPRGLNGAEFRTSSTLGGYPVLLQLDSLFCQPSDVPNVPEPHAPGLGPCPARLTRMIMPAPCARKE